MSQYNSNWIPDSCNKHYCESPVGEFRWYDRPIIVCLIGSMKNLELFERANADLTLAGFIVLSVGAKSYDPEQKAMLDELHFKKIDLADEVMVCGRVGESTQRELDYAKKCRKRITYHPELSNNVQS